MVRAMSGVGQQYAQIENETLATTWACERYRNFLIGKTFRIDTDHKPLVSLLGQKILDEFPPIIQRLRLRLMCLWYCISHVTVNDLIVTADTYYLGLLRYLHDHRLLPVWSDLVCQPVKIFCVLLVRLLCSRI